MFFVLQKYNTFKKKRNLKKKNFKKSNFFLKNDKNAQRLLLIITIN